MWKGCLLMLAAFAAALYFNANALLGRSIPDPWIAASLLSAGAMLLAGAIHGVLDASGKVIRPESDSSTWRDGQHVRVSGTVRPGAPVRKAPFSGHDAIFCEWWMRLGGRFDEDRDRNCPSLRGMESTSCMLYLSNGAVKLAGFPNLEKFAESSFQGPELSPAAARLVASRQWEIPKLSLGAIHQFQEALSADKGPVQLNVMNQRAYETLVAPAGQAPAASVANRDEARLLGEQAEAAIVQRMKDQNWMYVEKLLPPEAVVTVEGTYSSNPPRIDISFGLRKTHHTIRPGSAGGTAAKDLLWSLVFTVVLGAIVIAAHYLIYAEGGERYRLLMEWIASLG